MIIEKSKSNEREEYVMKIAELRSELESVAKSLSEAQGELDVALSAKIQIDLEKQAALTQLDTLKKHISELEQLIFDKTQKISQLTRDIANNIFNGDRAVSQKAQMIDALSKEVQKLKSIVSDFGDIRRQYSEFKELNETEKIRNKQLKADNKSIQIEIAEVRRKKLLDLPYWEDLKSQAEELLINASQKEEFVNMAIAQMREFAEKHNIPFEIKLK